NSSLFNASRVLGPALGGVVIAVAGTGVCFAFNAVSFLAVLAGLLAMREADLFPVARREQPTILRGTRDGLRWVWADRQVRTILIVVLVVSTFGFNMNVVLPLLASDTLHAGPRTFGLVSACFGLGALAGGLAVRGRRNGARFRGRRRGHGCGDDLRRLRLRRRPARLRPRPGTRAERRADRGLIRAFYKRFSIRRRSDDALKTRLGDL